MLREQLESHAAKGIGMWTVRGDSISMERLDGETIAINFDSGEYFSFQGSSADLLWIIQSGAAHEHWTGVLEAAFPNLKIDQEIQAAIDSFLDELAIAGLIIASDTSGGAALALPDDYIRLAWTNPTVHANDDLADLLIIDPIHDSSEDGWPQSRTE